MSIKCLTATILAGWFAFSAAAFAADPVTLVIHDKHFEPEHLQLPAGVKLKLVVRNQDAIPAEFESYDLSREVVVPGHGEVTIYIGPMDPGSYGFFNDFNHDMQGTITAGPAAKGD